MAAESFIVEFKDFVVEGLWGNKDDGQESESEESRSDDEIYQGESVCDSAYLNREDYGSVFQGESVCHPSYIRDRPDCEYQDESVYDSTYERRGECSVYQGESVCESTFADRDVSLLSRFFPAAESVYDSAVVAGKTAHYCRPPPAAKMNTESQGPYKARQEDVIDLAIAEYFRLNPQAFVRGFVRIEPGHYLCHGREIIVEMETADSLHNLFGRKGYLVVRDGPLTQPFDDYLNNKDTTAEYNGSVFQAKNALATIPQDCRMTFADTGAGYSRLEAMKVAKQQAMTREKAAKMMNQGQLAGNLAETYEKAIDRKLGKSRVPDKPQSSKIPQLRNPFPTTCSAQTNGCAPVPVTSFPARTSRVSIVPMQGHRSPYLAGGA